MHIFYVQIFCCTVITFITLPQILSDLFHNHQFVSSYFQTYQIQFVLFSFSCVWGHSQKHGWPTRCRTIKLWINNSFSLNRTSWPPTTFMLVFFFCLSGYCKAFLYDGTTPVDSVVQLLYLSTQPQQQHPLFSCSHLPLLALTTFMTVTALLQWFLRLRRRVGDMNVSLRFEQARVFYSLHIEQLIVNLYINCHQLKRNVSD